MLSVGLGVTEMRMLRRMCGVTKMDRIENVYSLYVMNWGCIDYGA